MNKMNIFEIVIIIFVSKYLHYRMNCSQEWLHELTGGEHCEVADFLRDLVLLGHQQSVATHQNFLIILEEMH